MRMCKRCTKIIDDTKNMFFFNICICYMQTSLFPDLNNCNSDIDIPVSAASISGK